MPDVTHEGADPMGAPATHRGPLENCPAPDCQDRVIEQQDQTAERDRLVPRAVRPIDIEHDELMARAAAEHQARTAAEKARKDADRTTVLRELHDRIRRGEVPYEITLAAEARNHNGIPGVLAYAQTALMQWLRTLADEPAEHRQPHPTHGDLLAALSILGSSSDAVRPAINTAAGPTPAPLTPCTCQQAIHKTEHVGRTVPGCTWCMPTPNIRPNRKPARTTGDVALPDHTVDQEA